MVVQVLLPLGVLVDGPARPVLCQLVHTQLGSVLGNGGWMGTVDQDLPAGARWGLCGSSGGCRSCSCGSAGSGSGWSGSRETFFLHFC